MTTNYMCNYLETYQPLTYTAGNNTGLKTTYTLSTSLLISYLQTSYDKKYPKLTGDPHAPNMQYQRYLDASFAVYGSRD
jgi:hypothetical protein